MCILVDIMYHVCQQSSYAQLACQHSKMCIDKETTILRFSFDPAQQCLDSIDYQLTML